MAQQTEELAANPHDLSSPPRDHTRKERTHTLQNCTLTPSPGLCHMALSTQINE